MYLDSFQLDAIERALVVCYGRRWRQSVKRSNLISAVATGLIALSVCVCAGLFIFSLVENQRWVYWIPTMSLILGCVGEHLARRTLASVPLPEEVQRRVRGLAEELPILEADEHYQFFGLLDAIWETNKYRVLQYLFEIKQRGVRGIQQWQFLQLVRETF